MTRLIKENILDEICCYRAVRMKKDSHFEGEYYCGFPPQDFGNEPVCKYQCTEEADNEPTVDTDLSKYSDKLWKEAYERGKNERPQGEWIKESKLWGGFGDSVLVNTCSECGESFIYHGNNPKFCPECGADMREVEQ